MRLSLILWIAVTLVCSVVAFSQMETDSNFVVPDAMPNLALLLFLFIGMALHWLKGFKRGTIQSGFWLYFLDNIGATITALFAGFAQFWLLANSFPEYMSAVSLSSIYITLQAGYTSDSAFNSSKKPE